MGGRSTWAVIFQPDFLFLSPTFLASYDSQKSLAAGSEVLPLITGNCFMLFVSLPPIPPFSFSFFHRRHNYIKDRAAHMRSPQAKELYWAISTQPVLSQTFSIDAN